MADTTTVNIAENSAEYIAYKLLQIMARTDGVTLVGMGEKPSREWILKTYAACLLAVKSPNYPDDAISLLPKKS